jgi:KDO2-lipid IV(A) lauroyltransferase
MSVNPAPVRAAQLSKQRQVNQLIQDYIAKGQNLDYIDISGCLEPFQYVAAGNPVILVTGHFGNWEMMGYSMAAMGFPPTAVARPLDNPYLNDHILALRQRTGLKILFKEGMTDEAMADLRRGRPLGLIADQDAGRRGFFVDFFGRPASTYKSIGLWAMATAS